MRRPTSLALAALCLALATACASHEKSADKAAAVGDWKTAEREYAAAVRKDPKKPELQQKYQQARAAAIAEATRKAQACWAARDVECAFAESDYVVNLDPGNAAMAVMRADASREAGLLRVRRAQDANAGGDARGALLLLASAREASQDPAVTSAVRSATPAIVGAGVAAADRHRAQAQYPAAIDLLTLAVKLDPSVQGRLAATQAEYERWKDAEAERFAAAGDQLLRQGRWAEAEQSYRSALQLRPQSRSQRLAPYAGAMAKGAQAAQARDFAAAERSFAEADAMKVDRGEALAQLDRVRVRPYAVSLRSALVRPVRPDGWPWAGARSRELDRLAALVPVSTTMPAAVASDLARRVPRANQPVLVVACSLPDGRAVQSAPRRGAYALLDGSFTVATNAYDEREISLRVVHDDGAAPPVDAGVVSVRLGDLVANREAALTGGAVIELRLETVPGDMPDGAVERLTPIPDRDNLAATWSFPEDGTRGFRIVSAEAGHAPGGTGPLALEVEQRGRVVYRTTNERGPNARWTPRAAYLFARPDETLVLRVVAVGGSNAVLVSAPFTGRQLETGNVRASAAGASAVLGLQPRQVGPGAGPGT